MNERALRFDSIIAICALLISCVAALASVYQTWEFRSQTRIIHDQYAAAIWPYLNLDDTTTVSGTGRDAKVSYVEVDLTNNGLGPALIRQAQLFIDGHPVAAWSDLRNMIQRAEPTVAGKRGLHAQMASIDASTTIRPGDSRKVFAVTLTHGMPAAQLTAHGVTIHLCYCSLNQTCWTLQYRVGGGGQSFPNPVSHCEGGQRIESSSV